jgi:hypothetical protein
MRQNLLQIGQVVVSHLLLFSPIFFLSEKVTLVLPFVEKLDNWQNQCTTFLENDNNPDVKDRIQQREKVCTFRLLPATCLQEYSLSKSYQALAEPSSMSTISSELSKHSNSQSNGKQGIKHGRPTTSTHFFPSSKISITSPLLKCEKLGKSLFANIANSCQLACIS